MTFTEVTHEGWFSRIIGSIKSVLVGIVLFLASIVVLFLNEGCAVRTARSLEEGAGSVVSISADKVDSGSNGKLVHMTETAVTEETLKDAEFDVALKALKLRRKVEMYQWKERKEKKSRKKLGGGKETVTTYHYDQVWSEKLISSSSFRKSGHSNPTSMPYSSKTLTASDCKIGAYKLSSGLLGQLNKFVPMEGNVKVPAKLAGKAKAERNELYIPVGPSSPAIGDVKITFEVVNPVEISIVSKLNSNTFEPYHAKAGDSFELLEYGKVSAQEMFKMAQDRNTMRTWIVRAVGCLLCVLGIALVFNPLVVLADVVPFMGDLLGAGIGLFALLLGSAISLLVISIAWIVYRPLLGIGLLVVAVGCVVGGKMLFGKKAS